VETSWHQLVAEVTEMSPTAQLVASGHVHSHCRPDVEVAVALAIGKSIWGGEVEPRGGWLKAARAALACLRDLSVARGLRP
jgi:hypothetical protein